MLEDEELASPGLLYTGGKPKEKGLSEPHSGLLFQLNLFRLAAALCPARLPSAPLAVLAPRQWSTRGHRRSSHFALSPVLTAAQAPAGVPA